MSTVNSAVRAIDSAVRAIDSAVSTPDPLKTLQHHRRKEHKP
ncbi:hypothetical protein AB0Q95_36470 [Streptomyces sp. NPDC059900]